MMKRGEWPTLDFVLTNAPDGVAHHIDALAARLAAAELEREENEGVIAVWRRRCNEAERERDVLLRMLAEWCVAVDNDASWDGWDHHYKDARYRPGPMREKLDAAIIEVQGEQSRYDAALERTP